MLKKQIEEYVLLRYKGIAKAWQEKPPGSDKDWLLGKLTLLEDILNNCFNYIVANGCHETVIYKNGKAIFKYDF